MHPYFPFPTNTLFPPKKRSTPNPNLLSPAFVCCGCWFGDVWFPMPPSWPRGQWCSSPNWPTAGLTRRDPEKQPVEPTTGEETWGDEMTDMTSRTSDIPTCHPLCSNWLVSLWFFYHSCCLQMLTALFSNHWLVASYFACTDCPGLFTCSNRVLARRWIYMDLHWIHIVLTWSVKHWNAL